MGFPEIASELDSATNARRQLIAQFIPAGARVLEIDGASLTRHLPFGCVYRSAKREVVTAEMAANNVRTASSLTPAVLCHAGEFFRRQLEIEHLYGIAAKDITLRLFGQERQVVDRRGQIEVPMRIVG